MSRCQFQVQSNTLLPRVDQILSEMKLIVSLSQTSVPEIVDVECSSLEISRGNRRKGRNASFLGLILFQ